MPGTVGDSKRGGPNPGAAPPVDRSKAFRERARLEADRYGPDPWIFVRELLQNSRDAGATKVEFAVGETAGMEVVRCRDNGEGMTFEHARRYLFSLYASSKESARDQAGKFGVGFWSVLRFEPVSITIRSRTASGESWGLRLDGSLQHATQVDPPSAPGTEITLQRPGGDGRLEHRVYDAVWQSARYLHKRDNTDEPLPVTINNRSANSAFALPAPSAAFRRGSVRGVVGLGPAPRVELFSRGLRVRAAACLEDLVAASGRHTGRMRVMFPELPGGLAPQALLESDKLEVLLSRSDARDNRAMEKLVRLAQKELELLIDRQVAHSRPLTLWRRAWEFCASKLRDSLAARTAVGAAIGALVAAGLAFVLWGDRIGPIGSPTNGGSNDPIAVAGTDESATPPPRSYRDLGRRYRGPKVDVLKPGSAEPIPLHYAPPDLRLYFAALTFPRLADDGSPEHEPITRDLTPYLAVSCDRDCVDVELPIAGTEGATRIPVPTGHRIVHGSVELEGKPLRLGASSEGHPAVVLEAGAAGLLRYKTAAAPDTSDFGDLTVTPSLPAPLVTYARRLRKLPVEERVQALLTYLHDLVRYDRSAAMSARHAAALDRGEGFIERTLAIGAGDCDVQNGLLVAMLHAADVPARLAVGYVGNDGRVLPWLHAWAEYRDPGGRWIVADMSNSSGAPLPPIAPTPSAPATPIAPIDDPSDGGVAGDEAGGIGDEGIAVPTPSPMVVTPGEAFPAAAAGSPAEDAVPPSATPSQNDDEDGGLFASLKRFEREWPWAVRSVPIVLVLLAFFLGLRGRTRRAITLDTGADLSKLLQGVLQQPGAFGHMSNLLTRPIVPLVNGDAISITRSRELAALGRLYRTKDRPRLALKAVRSGAAVLDDHTPEGRTVADALGAVDLDRWSALIERAQTDALIEMVNRSLRDRGEDWGVRVASNVPSGLSVLDLGPLGARVPGIRGTRLILVDDAASWLQTARQRFARTPQAAAFVVLDHLTGELDLPVDRRARVLRDGARAALQEGFHVR